MTPETKRDHKPNESILHSFLVAWEKNTYGVEFGLYSLGIASLALALKTVRPFLRFRTPRDIPQAFLESNMSFKGRVLRVEPTSTSPVLIVEHRPILSLKNEQSGLPIQPIGTDVGTNGLAWMNHLLVGKEVSFTLMKTSPHAVHCIINRNNNDVGLNMVALGFATVSAFDIALDHNKLYKSYYSKLLKAENKAEKRGIGIWMGGGSVLYKMWYNVWCKLNRKKLLTVSWL